MAQARASSPPLMTVAMAAYNSMPYLAEAIESILNQSLGDFEFLIVNDGSTDGSGEVIDACAAKDCRIRAIHQENRGFIASLNRMIDEAQSDWIARMDSDDVALPDRFARQWAWLQEHPDYGVLGTGLHEIDASGRPLDTNRPTPLTHDDMRGKAPTGPLVHHNSAIMRRDKVRSVGGYHSAFKHCEDYDLWLRLMSVTKMGNLPDKLMLYRRYEGQVTESHRAEQSLNAAVAYEAFLEREAGRPDPTADLAKMPPMEELDALFGRPIEKQLLAKVAPHLLYSPSALTGDGFGLITKALKAGIEIPGAWRTVARLGKMGRADRALQLAASLAFR
jgi:glycosyltransferase involved in cell wall biosynthesis